MTKTNTEHTYDRDKLVAALTPLFSRAIAGELPLDFCYIVRIRPTGDVDIDQAASWCVSADEYYHRRPHDLSLRLYRRWLDFASIDESDMVEKWSVSEAEWAADEFAPKIQRWIDGEDDAVDMADCAPDSAMRKWFYVDDSGD